MTLREVLVISLNKNFIIFIEILIINIKDGFSICMSYSSSERELWSTKDSMQRHPHFKFFPTGTRFYFVTTSVFSITENVIQLAINCTP